MSPARRNAAMDELERLDRQLTELCDWETCLGADDDEMELIRSQRLELGWQQHQLLKEFPEVRYWPDAGL